MDAPAPVAEAPLSDGASSALARVAVLIVNYNAGDLLARCVATLRPTGAGRPRIVIVDNDSRDYSLDAPVLRGPDIELDRAGRNLGFGPGMNRAAERAGRELLLLLNPDAEITPDALVRLVAELDAHPDCVLVSGRVVGMDGREQRGSRRRAPTAVRILAEVLPGLTGIDLTATPAPQEPIDIEGVSGACMLIRAQAFEAIGGFDEAYPLHFEDLDLFARLRAAGGTLRWVPEVTIRHLGGGSSVGHARRILDNKQRGLWRYLRRHVATGARAWQLPFWWLALALNRLLRAPIAALRDRRAR